MSHQSRLMGQILPWDSESDSAVERRVKGALAESPVRRSLKFDAGDHDLWSRGYLEDPLNQLDPLAAQGFVDPPLAMDR